MILAYIFYKMVMKNAKHLPDGGLSFMGIILFYASVEVCLYVFLFMAYSGLIRI